LESFFRREVPQSQGAIAISGQDKSLRDFVFFGLALGVHKSAVASSSRSCRKALQQTKTGLGANAEAQKIASGNFLLGLQFDRVEDA
jgi:hypothetical protein